MGKLLSIVITNNHIRIAELSNGRKGVAVSRLLTQNVPEGLVMEGTIRDVRAFAQFLTSTLKYANIKTKRIICSLPSDRIMTREIVLPEMDEEKLKAALSVNAPEYFPIDLTDYVLGYFPISRVLEDEEQEEEDPEEEDSDKNRKRKKKNKKKKSSARKKRKSGTKLRLMVVAAPNEMVQSYFDMAKIARLKLESVDYLGNSVFQLTSSQIGEEPGLVIQIDEEHTVLSIYQNTVMVLQRHVDFGISSVIQTVMETENAGYDEAKALLESKPLIHESFEDGDEVTDGFYYLVSNMKRVIEYYAGRNTDHPLEQVYLIGDGSHLAGLELLLENQLNLPVESISALKQVTVKQNAGITMREVLQYMDNIGAVLSPINLLPRQLEQDIRRRLEAKAYRIMILLALFLSLVIVTVPATRFFSEAMDVLDLQNKLLVLEDVKPILEQYKLASSRHLDVREVQSRVRTNNESLLQFIRIFEQLRPSNITITEFKCEEGEVSFEALAQGKKTVAKLILQLNTIANVSDVKVSALTSQFDGDKETVSFSLTCKLTNNDALLSVEEEAVEAGQLDLESPASGELSGEDAVTEEMNRMYEQLREESSAPGPDTEIEASNEVKNSGEAAE